MKERKTRTLPSTVLLIFGIPGFQFNRKTVHIVVDTPLRTGIALKSFFESQNLKRKSLNQSIYFCQFLYSILSSLCFQSLFCLSLYPRYVILLSPIPVSFFHFPFISSFRPSFNISLSIFSPFLFPRDKQNSQKLLRLHVLLPPLFHLYLCLRSTCSTVSSSRLDSICRVVDLYFLCLTRSLPSRSWKGFRCFI